MVTMRDVAREAGVSKATVSYVVSGSSLISEKTAAKVRAAMEKLGYSVNHTARALSTAKTNAIGVVTSFRNNGACFDLSAGAYLYGIAAAARRHGYDTMLLTGDDGVEAIRSAALSRRVDGVVVLDVLIGDARVGALKESGIPAVMLGSPADSQGVDVVDSNFEAAAVSLVERLYDHGHRSILFIGWPEAVYERKLNYAVRFRASLMEACAMRGLRVGAVYAHDATLGASEVIPRALRDCPSATAMVIHNDAAVVGAPQAFERTGIRVPADLSVVTVMPDQLGEGMQIPFDSVGIDVDAVASHTVDRLVERIGDPEMSARVELLDQPMHVRGSVRAAHED
ncbi:LacI family DNA-binding transcriptional regulator [Bifidobacterium phasiani]|uniref:LacI family DNA-binding transcriptional regulator n=1 Tax=Bifidobacterium phasiani TaxID=2834431 RepID=A0ABS6WAJ3_9BIFI|nr:LacI family DNA-binding transcriptional regulator [Bifidobacterium phasiani]MBW3083505.1 LacI family DNA-binding transcriptional regulator [Bifidobacterium phasiani]